MDKSRRKFLKFLRNGVVAVGSGELFKPSPTEARANWMPEELTGLFDGREPRGNDELDANDAYADEIAKQPFYRERDPINIGRIKNLINNFEKNYEFWRGEKFKLSNDKYSDETILARMMMSEDNNNIYIAGLIGQCAVNRKKYFAANNNKRNTINMRGVVTGKRKGEFSKQKPGVPFASNIDVLALTRTFEVAMKSKHTSEKAKRAARIKYEQVKMYRILAKMLLASDGNDEVAKFFNYGQTDFAHLSTQDYLHKHVDSKRNPSAVAIHKRWLRDGKLEIIIPKVNRGRGKKISVPAYIRFYVDVNEHSPFYCGGLSQIGEDNIPFVAADKKTKQRLLFRELAPIRKTAHREIL